MTAYAELAVTTNFSFLRGASHPQEMVATAEALGLAAIGIADRNSFAGVVRAYDEAQEEPTDQASRRHAPRDRRRFRGARLSDRSGGLWPALPAADEGQSRGEERRMPHRLRGHSRRERRPDAHRLAAGRAGFAQRDFTERLAALGARRRRAAPFSPACIAIAATSRAGSAFWPSSASSSARRSSPSTTCFITRRSAGRSLDVAHLRPREMHHRRGGLPARRQCRAPSQAARRRWRGCSPAFPRRSPARSRSPKPARFSLDELKYEYPDEPVPPGKTAQQHLEDLTWAGAREALSQGPISRSAFRTRSQDGSTRSSRSSPSSTTRAISSPSTTSSPIAREEGHPLPGPRLGGQQRGLLLPRHHRGQSEREQPPVRPLHLGEPRRAARHRRRFRA